MQEREQNVLGSINEVIETWDQTLGLNTTVLKKFKKTAPFGNETLDLMLELRVARREK